MIDEKYFLKQPPMAFFELPSGWWSVRDICEFLKTDRVKYVSNLVIYAKLKKKLNYGIDSIGRNCSITKYYWPGFEKYRSQLLMERKLCNN